MNILLTGATGFLGSRLAGALDSSPNINLTAAVRGSVMPTARRVLKVEGLSKTSNWLDAVAGQDVVIHTAARAHARLDKSNDEYGAFIDANIEGTIGLAHQAAEAGVTRFIFISSILVNGDVNTQPFTETDLPAPRTLAAKIKWETEQRLWDLQSKTGMELVVIRSPLIYGPLAPGNFGRLLGWIKQGRPLPLGAIHNQRSLVALDNIVDLILTCVRHPRAANQLFLAGDGSDLSTTELLCGLIRSMNAPVRLISVPSSILLLIAILLGKRNEGTALVGSLQVDIAKARSLLDWKPPLTVEEGLLRCVQ